MGGVFGLRTSGNQHQAEKRGSFGAMTGLWMSQEFWGITAGRSPMTTAVEEAGEEAFGAGAGLE